MRASTGVATIGAALAVVSGVEILSKGPLDRLDYRVALSFWPITRTPATDFGAFLYHIGQPWIACLVVGTLGLILSALSRRPAPALAAATALGTVGVCTWILKETFPHLSILGHLPGSFPSGHTGVAVVASGLVARLLLPDRRWRDGAALAVAAIWGGVMAWGRLVVEAHWLSDVIAGWGIGMVALVLALRAAEHADRVGYRST